MFFFFQAEDGIRDHCVTGVQTCALPICTAHINCVLRVTQPTSMLCICQVCEYVLISVYLARSKHQIVIHSMVHVLCGIVWDCRCVEC